MPGRSPSILAVLVWLRAMEELYSLWSCRHGRERRSAGMGGSEGEDVPCSPPLLTDGRDEVYPQEDKVVTLVLLQEGKCWGLMKEAWTILVALNP